MSDSEKKVVSEQTLIPVSLLVVIVSALVLGVIRVESIAADTKTLTFQVSGNSQNIDTLEEEDKKIRKDFVEVLSDINIRLARMEGAMKISSDK